MDKPHLIALSKIDVLAPDERDLLPDVVAHEFPDDVPLLPISAAANIGLDALKYALFERVKDTRSQSTSQATEA